MPKFQTGKPKTGGRAKGTPNAATADIRALTDTIVGPRRRAFWKKLREQADAGTLDNPVLLRLLEYRYGRAPAEPPEPPTVTPIGDPLRALAIKLLRLDGEDFRMAVAAIFAHEVSTAPPKALPERGNHDHA